eukprot:CAMPEP_0172776222 /NCGR_PEP_ID=MMETSP1074-20121228/199467_1 /TAXON_ID=2916 /ORGANISM="Ceratium fusus, Strain PA161109" /LENGTH=118 /DNA_ID=CAMNT_0013612971 /DNA_START=101 /DNA_END=457 /DNA_ORIENTATION=+
MELSLCPTNGVQAIAAFQRNAGASRDQKLDDGELALLGGQVKRATAISRQFVHVRTVAKKKADHVEMPAIYAPPQWCIPPCLAGGIGELAHCIDVQALHAEEERPKRWKLSTLASRAE